MTTPATPDQVAKAPKVALHEHLHVTTDDQVTEQWPVDLRGW